MENEQHPDIFQPTVNQYSVSEEETFRRGNSGMTGSGLPKGFISTDNEPLNNILYRQSIFTGKISELHDLIAHDLIFFCRVKTDLEEMLRIDPSDPACIDPVLSGKDTGTIK